MRWSCALCESVAPLPLGVSGKGLEIVACRCCGLVWNAAMADSDEQRDFYREKNRAGCSTHRKYLISMLARAMCALDVLDEHLRPGMKHLDIGCAEGTLLALTRARGLDVQGLELDVHHGYFAREVRRLPVFPETIESAPYSPASFDLISLSHVVEHLVEPVEVLERARELLRPDGLIYIEVPGIDQPLPRLRRFFRPKHNFYFSARTLRSLAERAGFEVVKEARSPRDRSLQLLARRAEPSDTIAWRDDAEALKKRVARESGRHWLLLRYGRRLARQARLEKQALRWFAPLLDELKIPRAKRWIGG